MSQDKTSTLHAKLDRLIESMQEQNLRLDRIERIRRPDHRCVKYIEERCLAKQEFEHMHRQEHERGRRGLLTVARLADYAWKALVTLALGAEALRYLQ